MASKRSDRTAAPKPAGPAPVELTLNARRFPLYFLLTCFALELAFVVLDYFFNYGRYTEIRPIRYLFSTTNEDGFASWFAMSQTLLSGATLWIIVVVTRASGGSVWKTLGWIVLAIFFTYMAIDDAVTFHERMGTTYKILKDRTPEGPGNFPSYYWQLVFLPFFGTLGLFMIGFVWLQMKDWSSRILVLVAVAMLVIAVGLDFIEGLSEDHKWNLFAKIADNYVSEEFTKERFQKSALSATTHFFKSFEECIFEAGANTILWFLFLRHLTRIAADVRLRFVRPKSDAG